MTRPIFTPAFKVEFDWKNRYPLRLGSVLPQNAAQIMDGLKNLSAESIHNRFLSSKKEFSQKELEYLTQLDGVNHYAIGIEERERPYRGVAIVRLVRSSTDPKEAEIAITIIDEYQRQGLGLLLMELIILAAVERKLERLSFNFLPQNEAIARLIHKLGMPVQGAKSPDYVQLFLELKKVDVQGIRDLLSRSLPSTDIFQTKT